MSIPVGELVKRNMHLRVDDRMPSHIGSISHQYAIMADLWHRLCPRLRLIVEDRVKAKEDD